MSIKNQPNKYWQAITNIIPDRPFKLPFIIFSGAFFGLVFLSVYLSNAFSYLSDSPETCMNCHVMTTQYSTWFHSSHRERATCNDCHVPHNNIVRKYMFKASDGTRHATMFTLGLEPQVIQIKAAGRSVVQENCLRCHYETVNPVSVANVNGKNYKMGEGMLCWECHREVPHGTTHSLASTPFAIVPKLKKPAPNWIEKLLNIK